ncbi:MAG: hypothetical protein LW854_11815 [Rubrivivax sp.]|jgi:hypothetical protein|nr:hypothetical protein [Rubrivivax sp.]
MKTRDVVIFNGKRFKVPQCIQRIDHRYTHGWQVRYGGTKMFSDGTNDGTGAAASLEAATRELIRRITTMPTPSKLQPKPSASKESGLPVGVSGPLVRMRSGSSTRYASLQVLLPRFGEKPQNKNVYIGSESTYTKDRFQEALERAVAMRQTAEDKYRQDEAKARRAEAKALKAELASRPPAPKPPAKSMTRTVRAALAASAKPAGAAKAPAAKATAKAAKATPAAKPEKAAKAVKAAKPAVAAKSAKPAKAALKTPKAAVKPAGDAPAKKATAKAKKAPAGG